MTRACDSARVFAKQYFEFSEAQFFEVRGPRTPVIFDATATTYVRDIILDEGLCRIILQRESNSIKQYSPLAIFNCEQFIVVVREVINRYRVAHN